jgi:uncharacterized protein YkwD
VSHPDPVPTRERSLWHRVAAVALLTALLATSAVVAPEPALADRDRNAEAWLIAAIDRERSDRGLQRLRTAGDMADVAAAWSARMAARGQLGHNPSYADQICCWTVVLENVAMVSGIEGRGGLQEAVREAHRLFMGSSTHRANILRADVDEVGVGVYIADDRLWVTQNFRHRPGTTPPPPPPPPPSSPPPPPPSTSSGGGDGGASGGGSASDTRTSRPAVTPQEVQGRLAELGWYAAEVDGVVGPLTREAVTDFQGAVGLDADGRIGADTLAALTADDPPHRSGAGDWADQSAAFDALRQRALEIRNLEGYRAAAVEEHPVLVVLDRVVAAQSG